MREAVPIRAASILAMALFMGSIMPRVTWAADAFGDVLDALQIAPEQRQRLLRGDIISYAVTEHGERELAVGLAIFVPVPERQLAEYLASGELIAHDVTISDFAIVAEPSSSDAWSGARFTESERDEAERLLDATPGPRFNLSPAEIQSLHALRGDADSGVKGSLVERVSEAYRHLLRQRLRAYQQGGLAGITPYARGGGAVTDPAAELRLAASDADPLARAGVELPETLRQYPAAPSPSLLHRFYWVKRRVQRRPDLSLLHQIVALGSDPVIHVERYFYVGHSYNAAQILTGAVAYENGSVVFATSRFSTDEVLGIGNQLKRSVGRGQLRDEMRRRLDRLRILLTRPLPVQSP